MVSLCHSVTATSFSFIGDDIPHRWPKSAMDSITIDCTCFPNDQSSCRCGLCCCESCVVLRWLGLSIVVGAMHVVVGVMPVVVGLTD